jgi:hypothetical protein
VAHPQVAAFARRIEGQQTLMGRTMHGIEYNDVRDEIIVPQQFAQAIITFPGDADGAQEPVRVIQGSRTELKEPDTLALDSVNDEIYVPEARRVLVFAAGADGNVAPKRILEQAAGSRLAVDAVNDLLIAASDRGIFMYERTAQGNDKPIRAIQGPSLRLSGLRAIRLHPPLGLIFAAIRGPDDAEPYVGVWSIHDEGDVPPRWTFAGPGETLVKPFGMAVDAKNQTVMVSDMKQNAVLSYHVPEVFRAAAGGSRSANETGVGALAWSATKDWFQAMQHRLSDWIPGGASTESK